MSFISDIREVLLSPAKSEERENLAEGAGVAKLCSAIAVASSVALTVLGMVSESKVVAGLGVLGAIGAHEGYKIFDNIEKIVGDGFISRFQTSCKNEEKLVEEILKGTLIGTAAGTLIAREIKKSN